ncbi:MAG: lysophospholipid acyltransferase family protein [Bdellovibrionota bacterium]
MFYLGLIFLKLIGFALSFFPRKIFLALGRVLGSVLFFFGFRRKVVTANIELAFPDQDARVSLALIREIYRQLGILFLEIFRSFFKFDDLLRRYADFEGEEHLTDALAQGKGVFVMTAHIGNWELLTISGPWRFLTSVTMVTKQLKPQWLHRIVEVTRHLLGVRMALEPKTMHEIIRALRRKEIVGFVMDQYAGAPVGARVPFFGKAVGSHTALATLALRTGAPVVPAIAVRKPDGRYLIRFDPVLPTLTDPDAELAVLLNTAAYVRHTEAWIREFPAQWLWIHKRWKGDLSPLPPGVIGELLR